MNGTVRWFIASLAVATASLGSAQQTQLPSLEQILTPAQQSMIGLQRLNSTERENLRVLLVEVYKVGFNAGKAEASKSSPPPPSLPPRPQARVYSGGPYGGVGSGHWISKNIDRGAFIKLEDGSLWKIDRMDQLDAGLWLSMTDITVLETSDCMAGFDYLLINTDDGEKACAQYLSR